MSREDASKKAEAELTRIRKLPENKKCANCLASGHPLHTAVVVPYRIFVCSMCKSAHQSFSHRCKSSMMSTWTMDEVRQLEEKNGGGNKVAQEKWFAQVRDSERPREGDSLDRFKEFVRRAYVEERWMDADGGRGGGESRRSSGRDRDREQDRDGDSRRPSTRDRDREQDRDRDHDSRRADRGSRRGDGDRDRREPARPLSPPRGSAPSREPVRGAAASNDFDFDPNKGSTIATSSIGGFDDFNPNSGAAPATSQANATGSGSGLLFDDFVSAAPQAQSVMASPASCGGSFDFDPFNSQPPPMASPTVAAPMTMTAGNDSFNPSAPSSADNFNPSAPSSADNFNPSVPSPATQGMPMQQPMQGMQQQPMQGMQQQPMQGMQQQPMQGMQQQPMQGMQGMQQPTQTMQQPQPTPQQQAYAAAFGGGAAYGGAPWPGQGGMGAMGMGSMGAGMSGGSMGPCGMGMGGMGMPPASGAMGMAALGMGGSPPGAMGGMGGGMGCGMGGYGGAGGGGSWGAQQQQQLAWGAQQQQPPFGQGGNSDFGAFQGAAGNVAPAGAGGIQGLQQNLQQLYGAK